MNRTERIKQIRVHNCLLDRKIRGTKEKSKQSFRGFTEAVGETAVNLYNTARKTAQKAHYLRVESRYAHLVQGFLSNRTYREVENKAFVPVREDYLYNSVRELKLDFSRLEYEWLCDWVNDEHSRYADYTNKLRNDLDTVILPEQSDGEPNSLEKYLHTNFGVTPTEGIDETLRQYQIT